MNLRSVTGDGRDGADLASFRCSTGEPFEDEVEQWINDHAMSWVNDRPRADFQHRFLYLVTDDHGELIAVVAWQDIIRIDCDGIWLEMLAVATNHQHSGVGREVLALVTDQWRTIQRDGDVIAGLVHADNHRSRHMLNDAGWVAITRLGEHDLMIGHL